jgi:hypothetical protein
MLVVETGGITTGPSPAVSPLRVSWSTLRKRQLMGLPGLLSGAIQAAHALLRDTRRTLCSSPLQRREASAPYPNPRILPAPGGGVPDRERQRSSRYGAAVRHATPDDLIEADDLLRSLRGIDGLVEKRPGVFSYRSRAFLHFHADPSGLYADVRLQGDDFERLPVHSRRQQRELVREVRAAMGEMRP